MLNELSVPEERADVRPSQELRAMVQDLAFELPSGDPATARLHLLLMAVVQELARLDEQTRLLADEVLGDRRYSIVGRNLDDQHTGLDGRLSRSPRPAPVADHNAGI